MNVFSEERYNGNGLNLVLQRAREVLAASKMSWNFVHKATVFGDLRDLLCCSSKNFFSFLQTISERLETWDLQEFGMKNDVLNYVKFGIPALLDLTLSALVYWRHQAEAKFQKREKEL